MTAQQQPRVSICIPTYNYGRFISDAIESVLKQTYDDFELLVVDNCSTDNTQQVVARYLNHDERILYFCNDSNLGMVVNWNRCLELARGEYVKILCADDVLDSNCVARSVAVLDEYPNVVLVGCARLLVDQELRPLKRIGYLDEFVVESGPEVIQKCLLQGNIIGEPTSVFFRGKNIKNGFNHEYKQLIDLEMWLRLLETGDFAFIPESLCKFRQHDEQATKSNMKTLAFSDDGFMLLDEYLNKKYITISFAIKQKLLFHQAYLIWGSKGSSSSLLANRKISKYYNIYLFYLLLIIKLIKKKVVKI